MLVPRAELPGGYVAELFHSPQGLLHKDVSSLEKMQLNTCLRCRKLSVDVWRVHQSSLT